MIVSEGHKQGDEVDSNCYAGLVSFDLRPKGEGQPALRIREESILGRENKKWRHTVKGVAAGTEHNEDSESNGENGEDKVEEAEEC